MKVGLYVVFNDPNNKVARDMINELPNVEIAEFVCPPTMIKYYRMPILEDGTTGRYFGIENIADFVSRRLKDEIKEDNE